MDLLGLCLSTKKLESCEAYSSSNGGEYFYSYDRSVLQNPNKFHRIIIAQFLIFTDLIGLTHSPVTQSKDRNIFLAELIDASINLIIKGIRFRNKSHTGLLYALL